MILTNQGDGLDWTDRGPVEGLPRSARCVASSGPQHDKTPQLVMSEGSIWAVKADLGQKATPKGAVRLKGVSTGSCQTRFHGAIGNLGFCLAWGCWGVDQENAGSIDQDEADPRVTRWASRGLCPLTIPTYAADRTANPLSSRFSIRSSTMARGTHEEMPRTSARSRV